MLRDEYDAGDQRIEPLVRAILDTDDYRAGAAPTPATIQRGW